MGSAVSNPSFSWPSPPLITKTGWVSHPTPPLLKLWIPQEDQQSNQPRAHDFCFSCALEREHFWHFSYFYLFFSSFQLTDCFLLLVFPFFLTHCIILTLCLIPVCSGNKNCIIWYGILIFRPGNKNVILSTVNVNIARSPSTYSSGASMSFMLQHQVENVSASCTQKVFHSNCYLVKPHPEKDSSYSVFGWSVTT